MKKVLFLMICVFLAGSIYAESLQITYQSEIQTVDIGRPLAIAADSNGGIYYTVISYDNADSSGCYYIANPLDLPAPDTHVVVDSGLDFSIPAGRAITGLDVDQAGNVYLAIETGNADTSNITKHNPAPGFDFDPDFGIVGNVFPGKRVNGIAVMTDSLLAVSTFDSVGFYDATTGELLYEVGGGETYQRDLAYNPTTHDIYLSKNRTVNGYPVSSANLLSGGSPDNLEGYTAITPNFIPQGGIPGTYGTKQQKIYYDAVHDLIIIPAMSAKQEPAEGETFQPNIAFYSPDDTSTPVATADASESPNGPFSEVSDAVTAEINGETYVFVADSRSAEGINRIVVFKMSYSTDVPEWSIF